VVTLPLHLHKLLFSENGPVHSSGADINFCYRTNYSTNSTVQNFTFVCISVNIHRTRKCYKHKFYAVTRLQAGRPGFDSRKGRGFFFSLCPDRLWGS